jgi:hypothetical protein
MAKDTALEALERGRFDFFAGSGAAKLALLRPLLRTRQRNAASVERLHELLCFMRAYPDDAKLLAVVEEALQSFEKRADLRAHRAELADSGIAGTDINYRFFHAPAEWLARRWPSQLVLDRSDEDADANIAKVLPAVLTPLEATVLRELGVAGYGAIDHLRGRDQADGTFLARRIAELPGADVARQFIADTVDASFTLRPGADTPSRTKAKFSAAPVVFRNRPIEHRRPDLRTEMLRPPRRIRQLSAEEGAEFLEVARSAMVTRARALDAFSYGNPRDVLMVDDGDGLAYVFNGVLPERRPVAYAMYGAMTLRNGVPLGYMQLDFTGRTVAVAFNTFATFRGGEAAHTLARVLAAMHHAFGSTSFTIEPYQIGLSNDEGIESGAFWFYYKLGFRPRAPQMRALIKAELDKMKRRPGYRSGPDALRAIAEYHLFLDLDPKEPHPLPALGGLAVRAGRALSAHGLDRPAAVQACAQAALVLCGRNGLRGWSRDEQDAWCRWAPLITDLDLTSWSADDKAALVEVVRARGGRHERDFVRRYAAHPRLDRELFRLGSKY